jgi:acetolactate decarboxylase
MSTFFQVGTLAGFLQGIYDGDVEFAELAKHGNFGLGTVNGVDGEMIAVDGEFYRVDSKGIASIIPPSQCTPFAVVNEFKTVPSFAINNIPNMKTLNALLDEKITTHNIFYMIRIDGEMEWMHLRSESCQVREYRPLAETLPELQTNFELTNSVGTLVVTRCPNYSGGITIPGYHYHYLDDKRSTGGHVFDLKIKSAQVMINPLRKFTMAINTTAEFDNAKLEIEAMAALQKIE